MKKTFLFVALFVSSFFYAQQKIEYVDYDEILKEITEFRKNEEYEKIVTTIDRVNVNDSIYETSLITKSFYLLQQKKYDEAIEVTNLGLKIPNGKQRYSFYLNKGVAYLRAGKYKEALEVNNEIIKEYPKNNVLYHNRGVVYEGLGEYKKAAEDFMQSITLNPYYAKSHLQLGRLCYIENKLSQALMAFNFYLLLKPDADNSFTMLSKINTSVSKKGEIEPRGITFSEDDETFEDMDLVLNSRMALNANYTIENKINIGLTRQNHAFFELLKDFEGNGGFWDKKYVPFYKWIYENDHFDVFTYTISYSIQNPEFKKIVDKKVEEITTFIGDYFIKWQNIMEDDNLQMFEGKLQNVSHVFEDRKLQAVGRIENGKKLGNWEVYNQKGKLTGKGQFDKEGKRVGKWTWFDDQGNVSNTEEYKNGKVDGQYVSFYKNGNVEVDCMYKNGELDGLYKQYSKNGALLEKKVFSKDKLDGLYESYYRIGEVAKEYEVSYKNDVPVVLTKFHENGNVLKKFEYSEGKLNGEAFEFFDNKIKSREYSYENSILQGVYKIYHKNGKLAEEGMVANGYYVGDWKLYYSDGTLKNEFAYNEASELDGLYKEYDIDGKLHYEFVYRNGEVIEYRFFNKKGEVLKEAKKKKGEFYYEGYSALGDIETEGLYDVKGGKKGQWNYYEQGALASKGSYYDNMLNGEYNEFYKSGQKKTIAKYKNDTILGYYASYFKNGNIEEQGWYKDDSAHGAWEIYYKNGSVKEKNFYQQGNLHGVKELYGVEGKLFQKMKYEFGDLISETYYSPEGSILQEINIRDKKGSHTVELKHYNNSTYASIDYLNGVKHGKYVRYNFEGKKIIEGAYFNGQLDGTWVWYHENGEISMQGEYLSGKIHGEWKEYFKDGTLEDVYFYEYGTLNGVYKRYNEQGILTRETPYKNGNIHGARKFYSAKGKLQLIRFYHNDKLIGYSYNDSTGKPLPMIPITNYSGKIKSYFENGKPAVEMEFKNGNFVGEYTSYFDSGQIEKNIFYKDGDNHGKYIIYFENGNVKEERNYEYNQQHGPHKKYYENGKLKEESNYKLSKLSGLAKYYNEQGILSSEKLFHNDFRIK